MLYEYHQTNFMRVFDTHIIQIEGPLITLRGTGRHETKTDQEGKTVDSDGDRNARAP